MSSNSEETYLTRKIIEVINEKKPESVKQLTGILKDRLDLAEEEIVKSILKLQAEGALKLDNQFLSSLSIGTYLRTNEAIWYWLTIATVVITASLVFAVSENVYPWIYARNIFGVIFVLFLPGYTFIRALFQGKILNKTAKSNLETIERIALSVGMSFGLVSVVGLILYYSPFDLNLTTMVFSLLGFTLAFSTVAVFMEFQAARQT